MKKLGIKRIAKYAGTSAAAVSLVINNKWAGKVRRETAGKVQEVIAKYGYRSNPAGRALAMKRQFRIGICIEGALGDHPLIGAFSFHEFLSLLATQFNERGYAIDIMQISVEKFMNRPGALADNKDGIVFLVPEHKEFKMLLNNLRKSIPYMVLDRNMADESFSYIYTDNARSSWAATSCFLNKDHKRIAIVRGESNEERFAAKLKGFKAALVAKGLFNERLCFDTTRYPAGLRGSAAGQQILELKHRPTAIFCTDNSCGIGLVNYLTRNGIRVPEHIEIIGFGDKAFADLCNPPLTFLRRPIEEMTSRTVEQVLKWVEKKEKLLPRQIECAEQLVFQGTTRNT